MELRTESHSCYASSSHRIKKNEKTGTIYLLICSPNWAWVMVHRPLLRSQQEGGTTQREPSRHSGAESGTGAFAAVQGDTRTGAPELQLSPSHGDRGIWGYRSCTKVPHGTPAPKIPQPGGGRVSDAAPGTSRQGTASPRVHTH